MKDGTPTIPYTKKARGSDPVFSPISLIDPLDESYPKPGSTELIPQASTWISYDVRYA